MDREKLEKRFEEEMRQVYRNVKEAYRAPNYLLQAIDDRGGFEVARTLMDKLHPSETFHALWEIKRLDLSVEALVLKEPWRQLFEQKHLDKAEKRLRDCDFDPYKNENHESC